MGLIKQLYQRIILRKSTEQIELEYRLNRGMKLGKNSHINTAATIDGGKPWLISIGEDVTIAPNVRILTHDASTNVVGCGTKLGRVTIENNVFIGVESIILCNTHIGSNVIVGAGSLVNKDLPSNGVYAGNPVRYICSIDEYKEKYQKLREERPYFGEIRSWYDWANSTEEERELMKEELQDGVGFF